MRARLMALGALILARLGFLRQRAVPPALAACAPAAAVFPPGPPVPRRPALLGAPGCNREGGAP